MADKIITYPTYEPLSLAEVTEYLRLDSNPADEVTVEAMITASRQYLEQYLNRYIATQTIETALTGWQDEIVLSAPVQSVRVSHSSSRYLDRRHVLLEHIAPRDQRESISR